MNFLDFAFIVIAVPLSISALVVIVNLFSAPVMRNKDAAVSGKPLVSVLVPARNEESNIGPCLDSIMSQSYSNLEIIIGNDGSTDRTLSIAGERAGVDSRVRIIDVPSKPEGWTGKNWACHQLSLLARGDYYLFVDSDVRLGNHAVLYSMNLMRKNELSMMSCFSSQILKSPGEYLLVPMMNWLLLSFLPLIMILKSNLKSFVAANGQFILFKKEEYRKLKGHKAVADKIVEDMEFARIFKSNKKRIMTALGGDAVFCRMYSGFSGSLKGFSKNFFRGFNMHPLAFGGMLLFFEAVFLLPFIFAFVNFKFVYFVIIIAFCRVIISVLSRQNCAVNVFLHPVQMLLVIFVGINSIYVSLKRKAEWKDRKL